MADEFFGEKDLDQDLESSQDSQDELNQDLEQLNDDDVIVLKDAQDEAQDETKSKPKETKQEIKRDLRSRLKDPLNILIAGLVVLGLFFVLLWGLFSNGDEPVSIDPASIISKNLQENELIAKDKKETNIEKLIQKASLLYQNGDKAKALDLFEQISIYNQSLSFYNLGVASMKEGNFTLGRDYFESSIKTGENVCESALNAGVCSLILNDKNRFDYYIDLAYKTLPSRQNTPIYAYLYMMINYYKNRPFQVIAAAQNKIDEPYEKHKNKMLAKAYFSLNDLQNSIDFFEHSSNDTDLYSLGLLNARIGNFDDAKRLFRESISKNIDTNLSKQALVLTLLKDGEFFLAGETINDLLRTKAKIDAFAIQTSLKKRMFDLDLAQEFFDKGMLLDKESFLDILFYFIPYHIIDPQQNVQLIEKGQISINAQEIQTAQKYLSDSLAIAGVNSQILLGVKLASNNKIISANEIFAKMQKAYGKDAVLEYNLGLSYAQLGDLANAYVHFSRAYFLDRTNKLSGVFTVMLSPYAGADELSLQKALLEEFQSSQSVESLFFITLLNFYNDNFLALSRWLDTAKKDLPKYALLDVFAALKIEKPSLALEKLSSLKKTYANDFIIKVLEIYAQNSSASIKKKAFSFQSLMKDSHLNKDPLYYGSFISRDLYVKLALLTGNLNRAKKELQEKLEIEVHYPQALMEGLALIYVYLGEFEKAFVIYNDLIDKQKITDTKTLLLASVAAIGANHKENAIALLELAIIKNKKNHEARYALALLYMEIGNYAGAAVTLTNASREKQISNYYDFFIKEE